MAPGMQVPWAAAVGLPVAFCREHSPELPSSGAAQLLAVVLEGNAILRRERQLW